MPNSFGNPFAIPRAQVNIGWGRSPDASLAGLIRTQQALMQQQIAQARLAGMRAAASGEPKIGRYTDVIELPKADGTKEKVAVQAPTQKERQAKAKEMLAQRRQEIIDADPEMQQLRVDFDKKSLPAQNEALGKMRQSAVPRLSKVLGMSGEELTKTLVQPLQSAYETRNKDVNSGSIFGALGRTGKSIYNSVSNAIASFTDTAEEMKKRGNAMAEQRIADNPYLDEIRRLETEGRSTTELRLSNPFKATLEFAEPIIAPTIAGIAGGAIGTAVGGPVGGVAGLAAGGGAAGALYGRGEAIERTATDPNLTDAQKLVNIESAANWGAGISGAIGAIPVGPAQIARMGLRNVAVNRGTQAAIEAGSLNPVLARAAAIKEVNNRAAQQSLKTVVAKEMAANAVDAATLNAAEALGTGLAYNAATGQNLPISENITDALLSGGALGALLGLPGARSIWRRRNQYGGQSFQTRNDAQDLQRVAEIENLSNDLLQVAPSDAAMLAGNYTPSAYITSSSPVVSPVSIRAGNYIPPVYTLPTPIVSSTSVQAGNYIPPVYTPSTSVISPASIQAGNYVPPVYIPTTATPVTTVQSGRSIVSTSKLQTDIAKTRSKNQLEQVLQQHYANNGNREEILQAFTDLGISNDLNKNGNYKAWKRRVEQEVFDVNRTTAGDSGGNGQPASVEQPGSAGARGIDQPDTPASRAGEGNPPPVIEPVANTDTEQPVASDTTTEVGRIVGTEPLDTGTTATNASVAGEPGAGSAEGANGEPGSSSATPASATTNLGERGRQLETSASEGSTGDAATAGSREPVAPTDNIPTREEIDAEDMGARADMTSEDEAALEASYHELSDSLIASRGERLAQLQKELLAQTQRDTLQESIETMRGKIADLADEGKLTEGKRPLFPGQDSDIAQDMLSSLFIRDAAYKLDKSYAQPLTKKEQALLKRAQRMGVTPPQIGKEYAAQIANDLQERQSDASVAQLLTMSTDDAAQIIKNDSKICR